MVSSGIPTRRDPRRASIVAAASAEHGGRAGETVNDRKVCPLGLFTIHFELGDKTLETVTRIASTGVIHFELGPETRAMLERLLAADEEGAGVGELVKKGAGAALRPRSR
jgi:hypothetical protein